MVAQMTSEMQWFLLQTKVKQEQRAVENLERQAVVCFCPMIHVEKISRGKRINVLEALFPGYLFVHVGEASASATSIRSTRGVSNFVSSGGAPIKVPSDLIDQLKDRASVQKDQIMSSLPKAGEKMNIMDGPFRGLNAVFYQSDGNNRALLLVTMLNQQVKASIAFSSLSAVSDPVI